MDAAFIAEFRRTIDRAAERLGTFCDSEAGRPTAPGKWSKKEIVGHLIDSAANNHGRFVRAQLQEDLVFPGYDQDAWVRVQRYRDRPWSDLVALWRAYNRNIACVMESADPDAVARDADVAQPGRACVEGCSADGTDDAGLLHARLRRASRTPPAPGAGQRLGSMTRLS